MLFNIQLNFMPKLLWTLSSLFAQLKWVRVKGVVLLWLKRKKYELVWWALKTYLNQFLSFLSYCWRVFLGRAKQLPSGSVFLSYIRQKGSLWHTLWLPVRGIQMQWRKNTWRQELSSPDVQFIHKCL